MKRKFQILLKKLTLNLFFTILLSLTDLLPANPNEDITIANPDYIRKLKQTKGYGEQVTWIQNPEWIKDTDLVGFKVGGKQHYMRFKNKELAFGRFLKLH